MTGAESPYKLDKAQAVKAVKALQAFMAKQKESGSEKPDLLAGDDSDSEEEGYLRAADPDMAVWLQVTSLKYVTDQKKLKPHRLPLPHPLLKITPTISICVIVKDPAAAFKKMVPELGLPATATLKITSPQSLRTKYKSFESRRQLERGHDIFLADERIIPILPKILGKSVFKRAAKVPIPIDIAKKSEHPDKFKKEIEKALNATYFNLSPSTCHSIRVGIRTMKAEDVAENIEAVVNQVTEKHVPRGWKGVRSLHVKFAETAALPIWQSENLYDAELDVLTAEELKKIEFKKSEEGVKARKDAKKQKKQKKKEEYKEKKQNKRHWDSDVEEEEEKKELKEKEEKQTTPSKKRKLEQAEEAKASDKKKPEVELKNASTAAKANGGKKIMPPMPLKKRKVEKDKKRPSMGGSDSKPKKQKKAVA